VTLAIAILMKDPAKAKTRLEPLLGSDARAALARTLFEHSLSFFCQFYPETPLCVVTPSPAIADLTRHHGAIALMQETGGINEAAQEAVNWAMSLGRQHLLIIHADIVVLQVTEINQMIEAAKETAVVIAASHDGGSNALLLSPPDIIQPSFGSHSAAAHAAAAKKAQVTCKNLRLAHLCHDIDTPQDLSAAMKDIRIFALSDLPEIAAGDNLAELVVQALSRMDETLKPYDIVVVAQKILSKSEGRLLPLDAFPPSGQALQIAAEIGKDARKVEAILSQSAQILRTRPQQPEGLLITRHKKGWICANAGIDQSNLGTDQEDMLLLLPEDPDASAARLRAQWEEYFAIAPIGVIISDSFGRPWRQGQVNIALGLAGITAVVDWRDRVDANGRVLKATMPAFADEVAASSGLVSLKDAGLPVTIIRGLDWQESKNASGQDFLRPLDQELFI